MNPGTIFYVFLGIAALSGYIYLTAVVWSWLVERFWRQ